MAVQGLVGQCRPADGLAGPQSLPAAVTTLGLALLAARAARTEHGWAQAPDRRSEAGLSLPDWNPWSQVLARMGASR